MQPPQQTIECDVFGLIHKSRQFLVGQCPSDGEGREVVKLATLLVKKDKVNGQGAMVLNRNLKQEQHNHNKLFHKEYTFAQFRIHFEYLNWVEQLKGSAHVNV